MDKYIGKRLGGRYDIKELIGVGGMANVYKATDIIEDKIVAVKILKDEYLSNDEFLRRFRNESKAIAVLSHPNIVKIFDVSLGDGIQYIVMEYVDGLTLKEYIEQQHVLRWKEAVHFTVQILRALQHAHDKGIVHRDIKPQNIMLLQDGTIKVMDFGIARFARDDGRTVTDKAIGSVHYISPEQARGDVTDEKSDIYSVGVMLFEMLTGKLPFDADSAVSIALMQMQAIPKMPRQLNETIPEGLEEITVRAMQKDPSQRYQSAAEMLRDIDEFKRNPSILFEYKYFSDEEKTKYFDAVENKVPEEEDDEEEEETKSKTIPILLAIASAFVVFVILFIAGWALMSNPAQKMRAPDLLGKVYDEIKNDPQYADIVIEVETRSISDDYPAGQIMDQDPKASQSMKKGGTIKVVVSSGKKQVAVPDVRNSDYSEAKDILEREGLTAKQLKISDPTVEKDCVVKTVPDIGTSVDIGTEIRVYTSTGPAADPVTIPEVVGDKSATAKAKLEAKGLVVVIESEESSEEKNKVLSVEPGAGSVVEKGDTVTLFVSTGTAKQSKVNVTVKLPSGLTELYDFEIYHNTSLVTTVKNYKGALGNFSVELTGSGIMTYKILYKNTLYATYEVNFDKGTYTKVDQNDEVLMPKNSTVSSSSSDTSSVSSESTSSSSDIINPRDNNKNKN